MIMTFAIQMKDRTKHFMLFVVISFPTFSISSPFAQVVVMGEGQGRIVRGWSGPYQNSALQMASGLFIVIFDGGCERSPKMQRMRSRRW